MCVFVLFNKKFQTFFEQQRENTHKKIITPFFFTCFSLAGGASREFQAQSTCLCLCNTCVSICIRALPEKKLFAFRAWVMWCPGVVTAHDFPEKTEKVCRFGVVRVLFVWERCPDVLGGAPNILIFHKHQK